MKKQILILVLFVMAIFSGVNKSYGQACVAGAAAQNDAVGQEIEVSGPGIGWMLVGAPQVSALVAGGGEGGGVPPR